MTERFKITGEWFIPTNTENRITGILLFDPNEGTELELFGSLLKDKFLPEFINQEIILGITSNGEQITLYRCTMTKFEGGSIFAKEESGKPSTTYSVEYLLKGLHVQDSTELVFNQISSNLFNLGEWIGISGFDQINNFFIDSTKKDITKIEYKLPENIEFQINNCKVSQRC